MKSKKIIKWSARILAILAIIIGLPFYFGYGNPLPFIDSSYTLWDNVWLTIFPLMFAGLIVGWKYKKVGGYLVSIPLLFGHIFSLISQGEIIWFMLIPLAIGILYLISGYQEK